MSDLVASSGRERAAKVAATAATLAHGWDRLPARELVRLHTALEDHARSYNDWLAGITGTGVEHVHHVRGVVSTIATIAALLEDAEDVAVRRRLAEMLQRGAHNLVVSVDAASRVRRAPRS
ncbi:MAG TPA: hypothetical protein VF230_07400 [Acidimicrobiales bacterium]